MCLAWGEFIEQPIIVGLRVNPLPVKVSRKGVKGSMELTSSFFPTRSLQDIKYYIQAMVFFYGMK